jgi:hypothetical protein
LWNDFGLFLKAGWLGCAQSSPARDVQFAQASTCSVTIGEGGVGLSRARTALMTLQAALSVVLMVGAALFVRSLRQTATVQLGYQTAGVVGASIDVIPLGYKPPARLAIYSAMRDRVAALPGVADVAVATTYPLQGYAYGMRVRVPGRDSLPLAPNGMGPTYNAVTSEFFSTLGIRIVQGRLR